MANRLCIGDRGGGNQGAWISNPGFNVLTAEQQDLMFDMSLVPFRVIQKGQFFHQRNTSFLYENLNIDFPSVGYPPVILTNIVNTDDPTYWLDDAQCTYDNVSNAHANLTWLSWGAFGETYKYAHTLTYYVTNIPLVN